MELTLHDILKRLALWTIVCSVCAAPSFFVAFRGFNAAAMITGVGLFILAMTAITCTSNFERFKRRPHVRRTLYIGYGSRVVLSIVFPVGIWIDLIPGLISIGVIEGLGFSESSFIGTLLITLLQGTLLNLLVGMFMLCVYGVLRMFFKAPPLEHECQTCGYDLRGNPEAAVCSECGADIKRDLAIACLICGYDLRGNPDAAHCSECGGAIEHPSTPGAVLPVAAAGSTLGAG